MIFNKTGAVLFGNESLHYLVTDREFFGEHWIDYPTFNQIEYHIRIRDNFWVMNPKTGRHFKATWLFSDLKLNQQNFYTRFIMLIISCVICQLPESKTKKANQNFRLLFLFEYF